MKILLIYPPNDTSMPNKRFYNLTAAYPPLGLAYIGAALEAAGHEVKIVDAKVEHLNLDEIVNRATAFQPHIVGISLFTPDFCVVSLLAQKLKQAGDYVTVIGGPHVSALPEETMRQEHFDYGIIGEGEKTVVELAEAIASGETEKIPEIPGLIFRNGSKTFRTQARAYIEDLDTVLFPAFHLLPSLRRYIHMYYKYLPHAHIITSRGCPYQCIFCAQATFGNILRERSVKNIIDEMELLIHTYGVREISIDDDLFGTNHQRLSDFCNELIARKLKIVWSCATRVDALTPSMLELMKRAGCWLLCYGIESGNQSILNRMNKQISLEKVEETLRLTKKEGIRTAGCFILGLPGDTPKTIADTIAFAKRIALDKVAFYVTQPYPGSRLHEMAVREGKLRRDVEYRHYHNVSFPEKLAYVSDGLDRNTLRMYRRRAYREFYFRLSYIFRHLDQYVKLPGLIRRIIIAIESIA